VAAVIASINKLKGLQAIEYLLASWKDPFAGSAAYKRMDDGLAYLQNIHGVIRDLAAKSKISDPVELCARMVKVLGLPEVAVNPLIAKSFVSYLKIVDRENLL
jgi:hypothetical protein